MREEFHAEILTPYTALQASCTGNNPETIRTLPLTGFRQWRN
jgi:hypothetical protein